MARVLDFGAKGDGVHDDTAAIEHAVAEGDGVLEFPRGVYRITAPIELDLDALGPMSIAGDHGTARVVMAGPGPAFRLRGTHQGTADPDQIKPNVWQRQRFPMVSGLDIVGEHPEADGIQLLYAMQPTIERVAIRNCRYGIHLAERNRNVLISACHIFDSLAVGVFIDRCNLHQMIISACHISYSKAAGIKSLGGDLHNLQITGNDIEYNYTPDAEECADIWFDARDGVASEITIASNTIQARISERGTNLRVTGGDSPQGQTARLITVTGNVLGSQSMNVEMHSADRIAITGNTLYDGKELGVHLTHCENVVLGSNSYGWAYGRQREMADRVLIEHSSTVNVNGMTFEHSRVPAGAAVVELRDTTDSAVNNCQIVDSNGPGIKLESCQRCRVTNNTVIDRTASNAAPGNDYPAIELAGASGNNLVAQNLTNRPIRDASSEQTNSLEANKEVA